MLVCQRCGKQLKTAYSIGTLTLGSECVTKITTQEISKLLCESPAAPHILRWVKKNKKGLGYNPNDLPQRGDAIVIDGRDCKVTGYCDQGIMYSRFAQYHGTVVGVLSFDRFVPQGQGDK